MIPDGRIIVLTGFTFILWGVNAAAQRWSTSASRVLVSTVVARFAGSRDRYVIWRNLTIQIGVVFNLVFYSVMLILFDRSNLMLSGVAAFMLMLALLAYKRSVGY
jgi:hypothetical protein